MRLTRSALVLAALSVLAAVIFTVSLQRRTALRFELGGMDYDYLADPAGPAGLHPRLRLNGPLRHPDGRVEVVDFYGRLTRREAILRLPYHALRSPVRIRVRCHRFGLDGTLALTVNGEYLRDFVFTERSYPWGGIDAVIPEDVAERGPLSIELVIRNGEIPPPHLPEDLGLGIDWIELEPLSRGALLRPLPREVAAVVGFSLLGFLFALVTGVSFRMRLAVMGAVIVGSAVLVAFFPLGTRAGLARLWAILPLGMLVHVALRRRFLSWLFVLTSLGHSIVIFAPNHVPPDLWNHVPQVEWLETLKLTRTELFRFSTSSDVYADGHVRPHFGSAYGAPYPPFFYTLTYAAARIHPDVRFLLEFLPVVFGAMIAVKVYLMGKALWSDEVTARLAALLVVFEISLWHHVHRIHSPGVFGELFVLGFLLFLVARHDTLAGARGRVLFAAISAVALLSYAAPVLQLVTLVGWIAVLTAWKTGRREKRMLVGLLVGFLSGAAVAVAVYYGPYALDALARRNVLLDRGAYDPPAEFFFLRNQMRDTVRILWNGYPIYLLLSLFGFLSLRRSKAMRFPTLVLLSCGATYVTMLVLKDPRFLPRLFLHAKEDLFYAPIACLLGALWLGVLWKKTRLRPLVVATMLCLFLLAVRDQWLNANTIQDQAVELREN